MTTDNPDSEAGIFGAIFEWTTSRPGPQPPSTLREQTNGEDVESLPVDEGRKRVLLIAAAILAARKLAQYPGAQKVPATICAISDAVQYANEIMREIDKQWPTGK